MKTPVSRNRRNILGALAFACVAAVPAGASWAQAFPSKPISLIVPYSPGGSADTTARLFAAKMDTILGQTVVVENIAGANGSIGSSRVANAKPDGYTLLLSSVGPQGIMAAAPSFKLPYDALRDFRHVALLGQFPNLLVVGPSVKATSLQELIAEAKARPKTMSFGSSGSGSTPHLSGELLNHRTGIDALHVPYKGAGPALLAVMAGDLSFQFDNLATAIPQLQSGRLRALAVTSGKRVAALPEVPTMQEAGVADFVIESWLGISAPAGTPAEIVNTIGAAVVEVWKDPEVIARAAKVGLQMPTISPANFQNFVAADIQRWDSVIKSTGVQLN